MKRNLRFTLRWGLLGWLIHICTTGQAQVPVRAVPLLEPVCVEGQKFEQAAPGVRLEGCILEARSRQPLAFATVYLFEKDNEGDLMPLDTFRTMEDARYFFQALPGRSYLVMANAPEVFANEIEFEIDLKPEDIVIELPSIKLFIGCNLGDKE